MTYRSRADDFERRRERQHAEGRPQKTDNSEGMPTKGRDMHVTYIPTLLYQVEGQAKKSRQFMRNNNLNCVLSIMLKHRFKRTRFVGEAVGNQQKNPPFALPVIIGRKLSPWDFVAGGRCPTLCTGRGSPGGSSSAVPSTEGC